MDAYGVRKPGSGNALQHERRLMAEELPGLHARGVLVAALLQRERLRRRMVPDPAERDDEVRPVDAPGGDAECAGLPDGEGATGELWRKFDVTRHPSSSSGPGGRGPTLSCICGKEADGRHAGGIAFVIHVPVQPPKLP